jgi:hypothetical protein
MKLSKLQYCHHRLDLIEICNFSTKWQGTKDIIKTSTAGEFEASQNGLIFDKSLSWETIKSWTFRLVICEVSTFHGTSLGLFTAFFSHLLSGLKQCHCVGAICHCSLFFNTSRFLAH